MRRYALFLGLLLVPLVGGDVYAQVGTSAGANVRVDVSVGLSVFVDQNLSFGTHLAGVGPTSVTLTGGQAGKFRVWGDQNKTVLVTLTPPASLSNGIDNLPYTPEAAYNNAADDPTTATVIPNVTSGTTATFSLQDKSPAGKAAQAFVYIYGTVDVGVVTGGDYSGTFTLTAVYQ